MDPNVTAAESAIGKAIVVHINSGATDDGPLWDAHWADSWVSIEATGERFEGRDAVRKKCDDWYNAHTVHACKATGPYCAPGSLAIEFAPGLVGMVTPGET